MSRFELLFVVLVALVGVSTVLARTSRFEHVHDDEDVDVSLEIDGVHVDGQSHIVAKTCFPVTMEVCVPIHSGNSTYNGTTYNGMGAWATQVSG